ncbi:peptidase associated/transthyretin-like domain-containing protein [Lyticum sinuosum]|nr:hypothetical protein [Lyticum sinuosum]
MLYLFINLMPAKSIAEVTDDVIVDSCFITPEVWSVLAKPPIYKTNNLRQRVGSPFIAKGQKIRIIGRIFTNDCVPLRNALVQIWHPDYNGVIRTTTINTYTNDKFLYDTDKSFSSYREEDIDMRQETGDKNFTGSGSCITNNLGKYEFFTILPGKLTINDTKKINFFIFHLESNISMETQMFFSIDEMKNDKEVNSSIKISKNAEYLIANEITSTFYDEIIFPDERVFIFNITLPILQKYKKY